MADCLQPAAQSAARAILTLLISALLFFHVCSASSVASMSTFQKSAEQKLLERSLSSNDLLEDFLLLTQDDPSTPGKKCAES